MQFVDHEQCDELVEFVEELADAARILLANRRGGSRFERKEDASPVTDLDRRVESRLREMIRGRYPLHGIVGEEFSSTEPDAEFVWVIDPIDGTKAFAAGVPVFTTLIALCRNTIPVIGVIDASATGDRWLGIEGRPTTENGQVVRTSGLTELGDAVVLWNNPESVLEEHRSGQTTLNARTPWRVFGADAYGYGRLASGAVDVAVDSGRMLETDICALAPIISGAGGVCTDGFGEVITLHTQLSCVAAATPELHRQVIHMLNTE